MDPCELGLLGKDLKLGECAKQIGLGLVPDWVWSFLQALPWIAGTIVAIVALFVLIRAYQFGGWIAVLGVVGIVAGGTGGYFLTRKRAAPKPPRQVREEAPKKSRRGLGFPRPGRRRKYNPDTNEWEDVG